MSKKRKKIKSFISFVIFLLTAAFGLFTAFGAGLMLCICAVIEDITGIPFIILLVVVMATMIDILLHGFVFLNAIDEWLTGVGSNRIWKEDDERWQKVTLGQY